MRSLIPRAPELTPSITIRLRTCVVIPYAQASVFIFASLVVSEVPGLPHGPSCVGRHPSVAGTGVAASVSQSVFPMARGSHGVSPHFLTFRDPKSGCSACRKTWSSAINRVPSVAHMLPNTTRYDRRSRSPGVSRLANAIKTVGPFLGTITRREQQAINTRLHRIHP